MIGMCVYSASVVSWPEALERIEAGDIRNLGLRTRRVPPLSRTPLTVMGSSGAGKSRIWSALTNRPVADRISVTTDDGYMVRPNKKSLALTTIPGQTSRSRFLALDELFGRATYLTGVVFVASYGYDHVWPMNAEIVASGLPSLDLGALRERNRREELESFKELRDRIIQKRFLAGPDLSPKWLLILVNKIDLYWDEVAQAKQYYDPDLGGPIGQIGRDLVSRIGNLFMQVKVLPVSTGAFNFDFDSNRGSLHEPSKLSQAQCAASIAGVVETLEELCNG